MSDFGEYDFEPVPGLPEELPNGEKLIWQGGPTWRTVALHVLHVRKLAIYFVVLLGLRQLWLASSGQAMTELSTTLWLATAAVVTIGMLLFLANLIAKTTLYTLTSKRVVLRIGIALPMTLNLPFSRMFAADLRIRSDGSGDIIMKLKDNERLSYMVLWPHVKMRSLLGAQPSLRGLTHPKTVSRHFADAIATSGAELESHVDISTDNALIA